MCTIVAKSVLGVKIYLHTLKNVYFLIALAYRPIGRTVCRGSLFLCFGQQDFLTRP